MKNMGLIVLVVAFALRVVDVGYVEWAKTMDINGTVTTAPSALHSIAGPRSYHTTERYCC